MAVLVGPAREELLMAVTHRAKDVNETVQYASCLKLNGCASPNRRTFLK
jgi:hypothetical protein